MKNRIVLDVYLVADADRVDIAADDRVKPYAAVITNDHVACNGSIWRNENIFSKLR
jgi:hypothetical protein